MKWREGLDPAVVAAVEAMPAEVAAGLLMGLKAACRSSCGCSDCTALAYGVGVVAGLTAADNNTVAAVLGEVVLADVSTAAKRLETMLTELAGPADPFGESPGPQAVTPLFVGKEYQA